MDGPGDYHSKRSMSDRETWISYDIAYMWNLKNGTNELIYKTEIVTNVETVMVTRGESGGEVGGGINWEIGIDIYTLLYIK